MSTDPVEWLKARLDEDERKANIISPGGYAPTQWRAEPVRSGRWMQLIAYDRENIEPPGSERRADDSPTVLVADCRAEWAHIVRWDPAAVVRQVAGARAILAEHADQGGDCQVCGAWTVEWIDGVSVDVALGGPRYPCRTVLLLAQAWGWDGG